MMSVASAFGKQNVVRWTLLVGVGLPVTALILCAMLSSPSQGGFPLAMLIAASYLGTLAFTAIAHYRPKFVRASVVFYMLFALGIIVSYKAVNPGIHNSCNVDYCFDVFPHSVAPSNPVAGEDANAIEQCF